MRKKVITMSLSKASITKAIREVEAYQRWVDEKLKELAKELAKEGARIAEAKFTQAQYDGTNDVSVTVEDRGEYAQAVVALGNATLFIEFGTGASFPDSHPEATPDVAHGSWSEGPMGKGHWDDPNGWYYAHGKKSMGNPANMSMYQTVRELEGKFEEIVRRVFES